MGDGYNDKESDIAINSKLDNNIRFLAEKFDSWCDIVKKRFELSRMGRAYSVYIMYIDGLADNEMVERTITHPILYEWKDDYRVNVRNALNEDNLTIDKMCEDTNEQKEEKKFAWDIDVMFHRETEAVDMKSVSTMREAVDAVLGGDTAIFVDGQKKAIILSTKKYPTRSIETPEKESGLKGPRDSFNENFRSDTALIRRRIKDTNLKLEQGTIGVRTKTVYGLMYMEDLVEQSLLDSIKNKLKSFEIDGIFDSGMLVHLLEDKWYSPFPQVQTTERPDKAASAILEGRVVLLVDNSPEVIILPATFNSFFQAADDYYNRFAVGTFARIIRYIAAYLSVLLPALYVAITCFYPQVLPTDFMLAIIGARNEVTFPVVVEVLLMEFLFELLREAGIRLPGQMGNTIGVVGGLIVGQAAVDASLVSTIVVIVVALTAICSFAIPNEEFASTFRLLKFVMIILAAVLGLYGILLGILVIQIHLASLESFGIPYMMPLTAGTVDDEIEYQDFVMRKPIFTMTKRPVYTREGRRRRFVKRKNQNAQGGFK